jgi:hypothetical protein
MVQRQHQTSLEDLPPVYRLPVPAFVDGIGLVSKAMSPRKMGHAERAFVGSDETELP